MLIRKAAVIGAGTMGTGIATHLANAGVPSLLLDIPPPGGNGHRARLAAEALERAGKARPPALMEPRNLALVEPGCIDDEIERLGECDWIVEAVIENLAVKRELYRKIANHRRPATIVSSNTSGLSLRLLVEGLDDDFRRHFLITHFFNPPRHMYLLELVRGPETLPAVVEAVADFADLRLGKGVVHTKDTPNFIANRIGVFSMGASCRFMLEAGLTVEEVDAVTGPALGRPKTASFRLHDLVGIDVAVMVMENVRELVPNDESRDLFTPPEFLKRLVQEGRLGRKTGAGFYKKEGAEILVLDLDSLQYRPQRPVSFPSLEAAKRGRTAGERIKLLVEGDDAAARYAWRLIAETLLYSARRVPEISDDLVAIDRALRWGFNWELGPFEIWDALGVRRSTERMRGEGKEIPPVVEQLLASGKEGFYGFDSEGAGRRRTCYHPGRRRHEPVPERPGVLLLDDIRERGRPVLANDAASAWDLGDGVLGVEFHSKMNAISRATLDLLAQAAEEVERGPWLGLVIGNEAPNFSVGANLVDLSVAAKGGRWEEIDSMIRTFHGTALRLRYCAKPVVAAVQGMALGGGCEIPLACARVQAAAETTMGLVELGVGLIPAGGGTRELACRACEAVPPGVEIGVFPFLKRSFQVVAMAQVSGSAEEARQLGFLRAGDGISMNRERTLADAKRTVLHLAAAGYRPPVPRREIRVGGEPGFAELRVLLHQYREAGDISEYDVFLGERFAYVLCGGEIDAEFAVTEEYLLDLERQVFLELCRQEKTLERIEHTLKTGKPLRN